MASLMALLSGKQKLFVDKMSQMLIRESSNFEDTSVDDELSATNDGNLKEFNNLSKRMINSKDIVDGRLVDIMRFRFAERLEETE